LLAIDALEIPVSSDEFTGPWRAYTVAGRKAFDYTPNAWLFVYYNVSMY
jgi:hypothetical protein